LVDSNSKKDYYPTIIVVEWFPDLIKIKIKLKKGVEDFLLKGANLMWPGVENIN